jgi:hypothetical protein
LLMGASRLCAGCVEVGGCVAGDRVRGRREGR